jgi:MFS family permease
MGADLMTDVSQPVGLQGHGNPSYRNYVLAALFVVFCFEVIDRILFGLVQESIKAELLISDFQLGLLGGPAFVVLNSLAALPIAYLAERSSRVRIVSAGITFWSFATAACGLATSFLQLVGLRGMVGIGGAACLPPSHSLISDYFPVSQRARALAIFSLAIPIGSMVAAIGGGSIAGEFGWRTAFLIFGGLGVLTGLIVLLTIKDPPRAEKVEFDNPLNGFKALMQKPSFVHITLGATAVGLFTFAFNQFLVSFMVRNYAITVSQAAFYFGFVLMTATAIGIFLGGALSDRFKARDPRALVRVPFVGLMISAPLFFLAFSQTKLFPMLVFLSLACVFCYLYIPAAFAGVQSVAGPKLRASAPALFLTTSTLIGYGLGPPIVGWIADRARDTVLASSSVSPKLCDLNPQLQECVVAGGHGLRIGLMVTLIALVWGAGHFWWAGRSMKNDVVE